MYRDEIEISFTLELKMEINKKYYKRRKILLNVCQFHERNKKLLLFEMAIN